MTHRSRSSDGFTLAEVIVASALAAAVMAAIISSFVFLGRNLTRLGNYQILETKSRQALTYLKRDFSLAQAVKSDTSPSRSTVTLVMAGGEVTYTYDTTNFRLRRQATFGPNPDLYLLKSDSCRCDSFAFRYYTTTGGALLDSTNSASVAVPYSIKQIEFQFILKTPDNFSVATRSNFETVSARYLIRNRQLPTGS